MTDVTRGFCFPDRSPGNLGESEVKLRHFVARALAGAGCHAVVKPWHVLRHTFASHFVMAGGDLFVLQRLLGHASPQMTQRYAHLAPSYLAASVAKMSFARPAPAGISDLTEARRLRTVDLREE